MDLTAPPGRRRSLINGMRLPLWNEERDVYPPDGSQAISFGTSDNRGRSERNVRAKLRRAGLDV